MAMALPREGDRLQCCEDIDMEEELVSVGGIPPVAATRSCCRLCEDDPKRDASSERGATLSVSAKGCCCWASEAAAGPTPKLRLAADPSGVATPGRAPVGALRFGVDTTATVSGLLQVEPICLQKKKRKKTRYNKNRENRRVCTIQIVNEACGQLLCWRWTNLSENKS